MSHSVSRRQLPGKQESAQAYIIPQPGRSLQRAAHCQQWVQTDLISLFPHYRKTAKFSMFNHWIAVGEKKSSCVLLEVLVSINANPNPTV